MKKYLSTFTATAILTTLVINANAQKIINSTTSDNLKNSSAFVSTDKIHASENNTGSELVL